MSRELPVHITGHQALVVDDFIDSHNDLSETVGESESALKP